MNSFHVAVNDTPFALFPLGIIGIVLSAVAFVVCAITAGVSYDYSYSVGKRWRFKAALISSAFLPVLALSIIGLTSFHIHDAEAKHQTQANVAKWAETKYGVNLDRNQADDLLTDMSEENEANSSNDDGSIDYIHWNANDIINAGNLDLRGYTDVAVADNKIISVQLVKLNNQWELVKKTNSKTKVELTRQ